jgi:hypothetical protein
VYSGLCKIHGAKDRKMRAYKTPLGRFFRFSKKIGVFEQKRGIPSPEHRSFQTDPRLDSTSLTTGREDDTS